MDEHEAVNSHDAIPVREPDEPYAGVPGRTRFDCVHLLDGNGALRSLAMCRAINVQTHPELKVRALAGLLHRLDDGTELALSFVYHDPDARKFVLVVPNALAHLELKEWSQLLADIAADTQHAVPAYVKDLTPVIGIGGLLEYLATRAEPDGQGDAEDGEAPTGRLPRASELEAREVTLSERERDLANREQELLRQREQLEAAHADLEAREAELQAERGRGAETDPVVSDTPRLVANDGYESAVGFGGRSQHGSHPPPLPHSRSRSGPPPLPLRQRRTPPPLAPRRDSSFLGDEPRRRLRSNPPPLPLHDALVTEPHDPEPGLAPPENFVEQRPGQMAYKLDADELWLFVRLDEAHASAFRHAADLMLQYVEADGYPVVVLSLVDQRDETYAVRLALDGHGPSDLQVLEHLSRSFRARVALYVESLYIETVTVATLREGVAQAIHDELAKSSGERPQLSAAEAIARVLHNPPPLRNDDLPFGPVRRESSTIVTVLAAVEQLAAWLKPDKLMEATLTYSVPRHVIDATIRRVVRSAIAFGVALPDELLVLAVEHGAASDEKAALREQLQAFRQRVEDRQNDLDAGTTRENWRLLLAAAEARQVEVDETTLALARAEPEDREAEARPSRVFETLTDAELKEKLQDGAQRVDAIRELCARDSALAIETLFPLLESLRPTEIAVACARLSSLGEAAGDGLIDALRSTNESVRQCAALALGKLQLRRALVPLLQRLEAEESPAHAEIARAFGDLGAPALRSIVRVIPTSARPDRLVLALAHLANHGSAREVEKLENDPDATVALAARKAMARRARMEWEDLSVREQRTLTEASPSARLSQAFYAEATKVAI